MTNCEHCARPLFGQEQEPTEEGKLLHFACRENLERDNASKPRIFEVEVHYSGSTKVRVVATSEDEAIMLVESGDIQVDTSDIDYEVESTDDTGEEADPGGILRYENIVERRRLREVRRRMASAKAGVKHASP